MTGAGWRGSGQLAHLSGRSLPRSSDHPSPPPRSPAGPPMVSSRADSWGCCVRRAASDTGALIVGTWH